MIVRIESELPFVLLASLAAGAMALLDGPPALRLPLGLMAVLVLPGYSLSVIVFPRMGDLDAIERLALAFGLSLALILLVALGLNATPLGFRPGPVVVGVIGGTLLAIAGAWWRRAHLSEDEQLTIYLDLGRWGGGLRRSWFAVAGLVTALAVGGTALGVTLNAPPPPLTEVYVLGSDGLAEDYARVARPDELISVTLGITNREGAPARYHLAVESRSTRLATGGPWEIAPGATMEGIVQFALPAPGKDQEVNLRLFREGEAEPYRTLRLWVDVLPEGRAR